MNCIKCGEGTNVSTTYQNSNNTTRRRRICLHCDFRFTTRENAEDKDVQRAYQERGAVIKKEYEERGAVVKKEHEDGLGARKGVDRLSHAWYNPTPTNTSIED